MSLEQESGSEVCLGSFCGCLVEGDLEQRDRERRIRRRALSISILTQSAILAALMIVPLLAKTPKLATVAFVPLPEIFHPSGPPRREPPEHEQRSAADHHIPCFYCPVRANARPVERQHSDANAPIGESGPTVGEDPRIPGAIPWGPESNRAPQPPVDTHAHQKTRRLYMTHIEPAMLIYRADPVYPTLARQTGRSGEVRLRAIIATDGTIQSLQVVGGDPLFYSSALDAVRQWRYKPTILNGQSVEVETNITVIYTMQ
jgi:periplasmic protein TonB